MPRMLIFGLGYTAARLATKLRAQGWQIVATRREADAEALAFADEAAVRAEMAAVTHILSSVPPEGGSDPVLARYGGQIATAPAEWVGYLSSTGVYGDSGGAWVDESAPVGGGRRSARAEADRAWGLLRPDVRRLRLPGIYGPGRSPLDRLRAGEAYRVDVPDQVFSRVHVDDIVSGVIASFDAPPAAYNLADDQPSAQSEVIEYGAALLGMPLPAIRTPEELSPAARAFYSENRRVANGRARRLLGWAPRYPSYREGLRAILSDPAPGVR